MLSVLLYGVAGAIVGGAIVAIVFMSRMMRIASERAALEAGLQAAKASQTELRDAFASLSHEALRQNRTDFLQNADAV